MDTTVTTERARAARRYLRGQGLDVIIEDGAGGCCWTIVTDDGDVPVDGGVVASPALAWAAVTYWAEADRTVALITFGVLLAAVAEHGLTRKATAAAVMAVAASPAFAPPGSSGRPEDLVTEQADAAVRQFVSQERLAAQVQQIESRQQ